MLTLEEVLYKRPDLTEYGFGTFEDPKDTNLVRAKRFLADRKALEYNITDFNKALRFIKQFTPIQSVSNIYGYSYHLKHLFEDKNGGYMANGVIIAAGISIGLKFRRRGSSAYFYISAKSHSQIVNS